MLIVGGLSVDAWLDRAGVSENVVVATAGPAPLFRRRRALGDSLQGAAKALLALGPTDVRRRARVHREGPLASSVKMTLARRCPTLRLILRLTVDDRVPDDDLVTVGGAELSKALPPRPLTPLALATGAGATWRRCFVSRRGLSLRLFVTVFLLRC